MDMTSSGIQISSVFCLFVHFVSKHLILFYFMCMSILPAVSVQYLCDWCPWRPEKGSGFSGTEVTNS